MLTVQFDCSTTWSCSLRVLPKYILYTGQFAVIARAWSDLAINSSANANISSDAGSALSMDGGVAVLNGFADFGPVSFDVRTVTVHFKC